MSGVVCCLPDFGSVVLHSTWFSMGVVVSGGPARRAERPGGAGMDLRADRPISDDRLFGAGVRLRYGADRTSPRSERIGLRRRPFETRSSGFRVAIRHETPDCGCKAEGQRPDAGSGGWEIPAQGEPMGISGFGKNGNRFLPKFTRRGVFSSVSRATKSNFLLLKASVADSTNVRQEPSENVFMMSSDLSWRPRFCR